MSGGVDSSVAALLLKKRGYDVVGVFMRCYNIDGCAEQDAEDARRVAEKLKISFYVWDFEDEYKNKVVDYMVEGYREGLTPNPDVMCNKEIKFGLFLKKALEMGADYIATGHYVKIQNSKIKNQNDKSKFKIIYRLFRAKDKNKDQSYFLWTLTPEQLKHCLFPMGGYLKSKVRELARKADLPTAEKKDSQGICFLGKVTLDEFLKQYIPEERGAVLTTSGQKIGEHQGAQFYTIGQRHGLNHETWNVQHITSAKGSRQPFYISEKDVKANTIVVAEGDDNPVFYRKEVELAGVNFINPITNYQLPFITVYARVRYRQPLVPATLACSSQSPDVSYKLEFDSPVKFVAPGQSAVFYTKDGELLGGGVII